MPSNGQTWHESESEEDSESESESESGRRRARRWKKRGKGGQIPLDGMNGRPVQANNQRLRVSAAGIIQCMEFRSGS